MTFPFAPLRPLAYQMIMVDPPWRFKTRSEKGARGGAEGHYDCMSLDDVKALPVAHLARGDALLWLWATHPMLHLAFEVMDVWGFKFVTSGVWVKRTVHHKLGFGRGYVLRSASEPFLIGSVGYPQTAKNVRTVIEGPLREHSRKPDEAYAAAEALVPNAWRCDLFSREDRPGWDVWGKEAGKFNAVAASSRDCADTASAGAPA